MRLPEVFSALTLNIILALFSMVTAIVALSLLAFVLAKESQVERPPSNVPRFTSREKIKRHESTMVDFRNPSTFPDHFLQLNTLMFQKKNSVKNNQITPMSPIALEGMERMAARLEEEQLANRALPPLPMEISTNAVGRHRRSEVTEEAMSAFVTASPDEDFSDTASTHSTQSTDAPSSVSDSPDWIVEKSTIEPLAEKRILDLECGSEVSLC